MKEKINVNTIKGLGFLQAYERSNFRTIRDCYVSPSKAKIDAEFNCYNKMIKQSGFGFRIMGYNILGSPVDCLQKMKKDYKHYT